MRRDERVFIMGETSPLRRRFGVTLGLADEFGLRK